MFILIIVSVVIQCFCFHLSWKIVSCKWMIGRSWFHWVKLRSFVLGPLGPKKYRRMAFELALLVGDNSLSLKSGTTLTKILSITASYFLIHEVSYVVSFSSDVSSCRSTSRSCNNGVCKSRFTNDSFSVLQSSRYLIIKNRSNVPVYHRSLRRNVSSRLRPLKDLLCDLYCRSRRSKY